MGIKDELAEGFRRRSSTVELEVISRREDDHRKSAEADVLKCLGAFGICGRGREAQQGVNGRGIKGLKDDRNTGKMSMES